MDEESKKMKDSESVRSGQEASAFERGDTLREAEDDTEDQFDETQPQVQLEPQANLNGVDEDLLEIVQSFQK